MSNGWSVAARVLLSAAARVNTLRRRMDEAAYLIASAVADGHQASESTLEDFRAAREQYTDAVAALEAAEARRAAVKHVDEKGAVA